MIYADVYGDILQGKTKDMTVLDVGGGYNALTKVLAKNTNYYLLDFLAHGGNDFLNSISRKYDIHWIDDDWFEYDSNNFDIIIANDIFPDVDQRMELFIDKYLPKCKEIRIVLTYYNEPKYYLTQRIDDTEKLTFLSYDGEITALKLRKYVTRLVDTDLDDLDRMSISLPSIYRNGRQVAYLKITGDLV